MTFLARIGLESEAIPLFPAKLEQYLAVRRDLIWLISGLFS